jgi:hypothetical protein
LTALDNARNQGKSEVVALLSEPRYAMKTDQRKQIERSGRAVLGTRRRRIAGRRRTNGGDSPWDAAERMRRPTCVALECLAIALLSEAMIDAEWARAKRAVMGTSGVGGSGGLGGHSRCG